MASGQITWKEIFRPTLNEAGGLANVSRGVYSKLFDNFEDYVDSAALQTIWTNTGNAGAPTIASGIYGQKSMQTIVAGGSGTLYRAINNNIFGFFWPQRIRYVKFNASITSGNSTIRMRLSDASDATMYKEWQFTIGTDGTIDRIVDLNEANGESYPAPVANGATTWNTALIDRLTFTNLADTYTYKFDDIVFYYEFSLLEALGFGTEPGTDDGADGSIQSKIRKLSLQVQELIGTTEQFSKTFPAVAYLGNAYTFGLELKGTAEQGIPDTTEIVPGNYQIDRVRNGTTTNIVASSAASESAGFIYINYTPLEDNWQPGDQLIVTFSGGSVYNDTDVVETLTANANAGQALITVANAAKFQVGQRVRIYDSTPDTEWGVVLSIDSPTQLTLTGNLSNNYTTAASASIVLVEQTILETARILTNVTFEPEISKELQRWVLADYDDFDFADADGNNERWDVGYIANSDGSAAGAEGGSADINTTTVGKARVSVNPDATPTQAAYALKKDEPFYSKYYSVAVDANVALNNGYATSTLAGLRLSASDIDDPNNYILIAREVSNAIDRITAKAEFNGIVQTTVNAAVTDNAIAFKIERYGNVYNVFYSLTQYPNQVWVKLTQFEDANGDMSSTTSCYLYAESGGTDDLETAVVDFDNWKYYIGSGAIDQLLSTSILGSGTFTTSSVTVPADTGRLEGNDFWNYTLLVPTTGVVAFQPRVIVDFTNAGGIFAIDTDNPFTSAPAVGDEYIILAFQYPALPTINSTSNQTSPHVVGNKTDTAVPMPSTTASLAGYTKAIAARGMEIIKGTITGVSVATTTFTSTDLIGFGDNYFNEEFSLQIVKGVNNTGVTHDVTDYTSATGEFVTNAFAADVTVGDEFVVIHKTQLLLIPTEDITDPVDITAEVPDNSVLAHVLTDDGDSSVYDRRRMSLEAITNALGVVNPGGTGFDGDGSGTTLYEAVVGVTEAIWMDGTAQQSLADMPYIQEVLHSQPTPRVAQDSQIIATLSLHNLRPDSDVVQTTEYSGTTISIYRYRKGVDTDWTVIVNAAAMTEAAGQATYSYTFPSTDWQTGDLIRYTVQSCVVEIPAASGQIYTLPTVTSYGMAQSSLASSNPLTLPIFSEFWETETIEADVWTVTNPATGTLAIDVTEAGRMKVGISPNANETGRLVSDFRLRLAPDQVGTNSITRKLIAEFEAKFTTIANIDNTLSFFGFSATTGTTRTTNNIAAFTLTGDALFATTDDGGVENDAAAGAPTLTNWNKFRIEAYSGAIDFYVNEVRTNHFTANLPDQMMYLNFYSDTEAGGAATFDLGPVRTWYEDII